MPVEPEEQHQKIDEIHFLENLKFIPGRIVSFFVSNIVQRSLAHLVGWTGEKSKMLLCTTAGILKVAVTGTGYEEHLVHRVTGADTYTYLDWTSEVPSRVYIECRDYDALVSFANELGDYGPDLTIRAGESRQIERTAYKCRYKNETAGNNASLYIEGYY